MLNSLDKVCLYQVINLLGMLSMRFLSVQTTWTFLHLWLLSVLVVSSRFFLI